MFRENYWCRYYQIRIGGLKFKRSTNDTPFLRKTASKSKSMSFLVTVFMCVVCNNLTTFLALCILNACNILIGCLYF